MITNRTIAVVCTPILLLLSLAIRAAPGEEAIVFEGSGGATTAAFRGQFEVPEHRGVEGTRMIQLGYVRFPATTERPGPPIVYLAGGPGGSGTGTARGRRFELFMALRRHADVIAFDQRGTGSSSAGLPECVWPESGDPLALESAAAYAQAWRNAIRHCRAFWRGAGVDPSGYTTLESVADLSDLRRHLGAERIDLWGISYGTHLALAALTRIPDEIGRAILASVEGLDQTVKLPSRTDAYFSRLQAAVDAQAEAARRYPDVAALVRRVHARSELDPPRVSLPNAEGGTDEVLLRPHLLAQLAGGLISDPQSAAILLAMYAALDAGDVSLLQAVASRFVRAGEPISMRLMPTTMDIASGISEARLRRVEREAATALLGAQLNFPMPQAASAWPELDLGDAFRTPPRAATPVLVLSGTLDGRTYPESQLEAVAGLSNVHVVTVAGAGHNLFMTSEAVHEVMHAFLNGETDLADRIEVAVPDLTSLPF